MEAHFLKHLIPSTSTILPMKLQSTNILPRELVRFPFYPKRAIKKTDYSCVIQLSKVSAYQDFQGFAKPSRLLPVTESNTYTKYMSDEILSSVELDKSSSFYMIELTTSKEFGSCLIDLNAAILISLINANGDSILQRVSAVSSQHPDHGNDGAETIHFQRGSVDIVTFKGPDLGKIESLWIGIDSGSWRLDGITLTVINSTMSASNFTEGPKEELVDTVLYKFEANSMLLGDGGASVAELRPALVTQSSSESLSTFLMNVMHHPSNSSAEPRELSNEESMQEYSDLKFSLLLYDFILFFTGSLILSTINERHAYSFLVGGVGGFCYLLLLQRSVDGLPTGAELQNLAQGVGRLKGPLFTLALILASSVAALKYGTGGSSLALTPAELIIGAAGFLTCKIAVVLAAFKPIKRSLEEEK